MQDKTINRALIQIWRNKEPGWEFAWGALMTRGVDPPPQSTRKHPRFRRRELRNLVLTALREGPKEIDDVTAYLIDRRPDIGFDIAKRRAVNVLSRLRKEGKVGREGRLWLAAL